ncbi:SEL1-like repeat protein [Salmonella enterica subsp. enterica serovar Oranienburg]|nr:SEL1-like repeat protein [Salmonella enterica subsp. enterica serovar Oranienburg]
MTAQFQLGRKYHIVDGVESDIQKAIFRHKNTSKRMMTLRN